MGGQNEDLYHNFSRKDLQGLCKKYGLPANKSNSEMATSLILYLEKKNLNSRIIWEATKSDSFPSGTLELLAGRRMSPVGDQRKDRGTENCSGSGKNQCVNQELQQKYSLECKDPATSEKASEDVGTSSHCLGDSNSSAGIPENTFSYVARQSVRAPSPHFQFDVSSEDGIELFVDLDSSPSDWIEELKVGVHICPDMRKLDLSSCHPELGRLCCSKQVKGSSLVDSYEEMDNGGVEWGPNLNTSGVAQVEPNGEESLSFPGCNSGNSAHSPEILEDAQATTSSRLEFDTEKQVRGAKSCVREGTVRADPGVNAVPLIETCHNSSGNSSSSDCKCPRVLETQGLNVGTDIFKKPSSFQEIYGAPDSIWVCRGSSASTSVNIPVSSGNSVDQDKVMSLDFSDQPQGAEMEHCGLTNSVQFLKCAPKMLPVETTDQTKFGFSSDWINNSNALDAAYLNLQELETQQGKVSTSSNSSMQSLEPSKHLASNCLKNMSVSTCYNEFQEVVNLPNFVRTENGGILRQHGIGKEAIGMNSCGVIEQRKNVSVSSCSNGGSLHLVVPKQNGGGLCTLAESNKLDQDIHKMQPSTLENLDRVNAGDQRKSSEWLDFRETMAESRMRLAGSETCRELKRKRQVNSADERSQSVKPDAKIARTSKQFVRDVHAIRRRSSRFFTK